MLAVHFGAGNIGRGFIGLLLHQAGYEVCFVDVNQALVDELNRRRSYMVKLAQDDGATIQVSGVRAIDGRDGEAVADAIAAADLVTTAVGPQVLKAIAPAIAAGISRRLSKQARPLNVIACENMIGGSSQLKEYVWASLSEGVRQQADILIGFPDAAVDRIVPLQKHDDPLLVTVEPFSEWIVEQTHICGPKPEIAGLTYVDQLQPYIERKLYTVNTGHAIIAYLGYALGYATVDQALNDPFVARHTRGALAETGALLVAKHQFDEKAHQQYVEKMISRFANPHITDEVTRVGRSPLRKLSAGDRLTGPAMQAYAHEIVPQHLAMGIAAALMFDAVNDPEAQELQQYRQAHGMAETLRHYAAIPAGHPLLELVAEQSRHLQLQVQA